MHQILERLHSELASALDGLDVRQTQLTPRIHPEKWNIQQIVEHLLLSYRSTQQTLAARVEKRTPTQARPSPRKLLSQFAVISCGWLPSGRSAPEAVTPSLSAPLRTGGELAHRLRDELAALDAVAAQAEQLFGNRRFATHFVLGPLSALQWRRFHLVHGRHHLRQIRAIRKDHAL